MELFKYSIPDILEIYKEKSKHPDALRNLEVYEKIINQQMTITEIIKYYPALNSSYDVEKIIKSIEGFINYHSSFLYEKFRFEYLKKKNRKVEWGKFGKNVADFKITTKSGDVIFESTKFMALYKKFKLLFKASKIEILKAKEYVDLTGFKTKVRVHLYNKINNQIYEKYIPNEIIVNDIPLTSAHYHIFHVNEYIKEDPPVDLKYEAIRRLYDKHLKNLENKKNT